MTNKEYQIEKTIYGLIGFGAILLVAGVFAYFVFIEKKERELQAERAIPIYDLDKSYGLSTNEFYRLIDERVTLQIRKKCYSLFNEADSNRNGELTSRELECILDRDFKSSIVEGMRAK